MIPKIIHHVWPGDDPFKQKFHDFRVSWMKLHPDWTFYFWRLDNLPDSINNDVLRILQDDRYSITVKSDILRYEILRLFGGIYTDTDMECLKSLDTFRNLDFFTGYEDTIACPSLIGCTPNHPAINDIINSALHNLLHQSLEDINYAPNKFTGPVMFTDVLTKYSKNVTIFDRSYFYPIHYTERHRLNEQHNTAYTKHYWSGMDNDGWTKVSKIKETFSNIYNNNTWTNGSGPGSEPSVVVDYVNVLVETIKKYNIKTVLDYGCGDWQFSKLIDWKNLVDSYIGVDIVDSVIQHHINTYSTDKIKFENVDNAWQFPQVDLIICKDVLQHLPNSIVEKLIESFEKSSQYMILTNDIGGEYADCEIGSWRPIEFNKEPWNKNGTVLLQWNPHDAFIKETILIKNEN